MQSLYSVVLSSPGLGAPTLATVEAHTSRIIGLNWQVSDRRVTSHMTCCLATIDRHVAPFTPNPPLFVPIIHTHTLGSYC